MDSLNGHTIEEVKQSISNQIKYDVNDIRLFGSRIDGRWTDKSDLDVAILDSFKVDYPLFSGSYLGLPCEFRFVDSFEVSWLKNSV